jgi:Transposase DDE domain group 1
VAADALLAARVVVDDRALRSGDGRCPTNCFQLPLIWSAGPVVPAREIKPQGSARPHFRYRRGYEDADDLDRLRSDPAFKLACGRLPDTGVDLCSQPTVSRWENTPFLARSHPPDGGYG